MSKIWFLLKFWILALKTENEEATKQGFDVVSNQKNNL